MVKKTKQILFHLTGPVWSEQVCSRCILQKRLDQMLTHFSSHSSWLTVGAYLFVTNTVNKTNSSFFIFFFHGRKRAGAVCSRATGEREAGTVKLVQQFDLFAHSTRLLTLICAFRAESLLKDHGRLQLQKDAAPLCVADIGMGIQLGRLDFLNRGRN